MNKEIVLSEIKKGVNEVGATIRSMPWQQDTFYANWCVQTFKYVSHSAPLIKFCAEKLGPGELKTEMNGHYQEEVGHEKFAARDAEFFRLNAREAEELPETKAIYAEIYDLIERNPAAMYGYALALENVSKDYGPWIAREVCEHFGINPAMNHKNNVPASFLTLHADVDQEHAEHGLATIDKISESDMPVVVEVMKKTFHAYDSFLKAIRTRYADL